MNRKYLICFCIFAILLSAFVPSDAFAEGINSVSQEQIRTIHIKTDEDLYDLAEKCRLDSYSKGLTVELDNDIDLNRKGFIPIPSFSGTFNGNNHTISSYLLGSDGSNQGFIRYLKNGGTVCNLKISGSSKPGLSACQAGGFAGVSYGSIINCSFDGEITGINYVGGIAGINYGIIEDCTFTGQLVGKRCSGGIAGYSSGRITGCVNKGNINTEITEGGLDVDNLTIPNIIEGLNLVTAQDNDIVSDTGGIAGYSQGFIISCSNKGEIGYPHYGYNVGGIAGRQAYYISNCRNSGKIQGRKDIGGITGQMEPFLILTSQNGIKAAIQTLSDTTNYALSRLSENSGPIRNAMDSIESAGSSVGDTLLEIYDDPDGKKKQAEEGWDEEMREQYLADRWDIVENGMNSMSDGMSWLGSAVQNSVVDAAGDFQGVSYAAQAVLNLFANAISGNMNVFEYNDVSKSWEEQKPEDMQGKVTDCINAADVEGDIDIGGISGSMAVENEFDMDSSLRDIIKNTLDIESVAQLKYDAKCSCVSCSNSGGIYAKKNGAGGISGTHEIGTIVNCKNTADVQADLKYAGGIAGASYSLIDNCYAMCSISTPEFAGGISGLGSSITDCATIVRIENVNACIGAICGYMDLSDYGRFSGNTFVSDSLGAIDGISYDGYSYPVDYATFAMNEELPEELSKLSIVFKADGKLVKKIQFTYGGTISASQIPDVPEKEGYTGSWPDFDFKNIRFGETLEAVYVKRVSAIESNEKQPESGLPRILLDGNFNEGASISLQPFEGDIPNVENGVISEAWTVTLENSDGKYQNYVIRYLTPETKLDNHKMVIYTRNGDGNWSETPAQEFGRYLGFDCSGDTVSFCCADIRDTGMTALFGILIALVLAFAVILVIRIRKDRKMRNDGSEETGCDSEESSEPCQKEIR